MDLRLICESCGVKWFVRNGMPAPDDPPACAACGGDLVPLELPAEEQRPGWSADAGP